MGVLRDIQNADKRRSMECDLIVMGCLDDKVVMKNPPSFEWEPDERERAAIMLEIADGALAMADVCGADSEEAAEAREFYFSVRDKPMAEAKEEIQGYFFDMYEAVMGDIDKYYDKSPDLRRLIRLTLGIRGED